MSRFPGNIIKLPNVTPTQSSASGVWSLKDQMVYQRNNLWPFQRDPYFNYTTLLLQGNVPNTTGPQAMNLPLSYNADASTNNFLVTPNGDVGPRPFSPYFNNYSGFFESTASYVRSTSNVAAISGDFTIEGWVFWSASSGAKIIAALSSDSIDWWINAPSGTISYYTGAATRITTSAVVPQNSWTHVALVRSSGVTKIYINGVADGATYSSSATIGSGSEFLYVGRDSGTSFMAGYLSNVRLVIGRAVYTSNFVPETIPLGATTGGQNPPQGTETKLLILQSNRFIDNATSGLGVSVVGTPRITDNSPFVSTDFTTGAGYFDGTTDYLNGATNTATAFNLTGDFTIEMWIYCTDIAASPSGGQGFISWSDSSGWNGWQVYHVSGSLKFEFLTGSTGAGSITSSTITNSQWVHIAVVRSGTSTNNINFYVNGTANGSASYNSSQTSASSFIKIGTDRTGTNYLRGYIAGLRVVNGTAVYTGNFSPPSLANLGRSGATSIAAYPSTTNVNTSFAESATSLLTLQTRAPSQNINFIDSSPNEFIVTKNGNTTQGTFSPFSPTGWGNYFNGSTDYLSLSDNAAWNMGSGDFTAECWIYPTSFANQGMILGQWSGDVGGTGLNWALMFDSGGSGYLRFLTSSNGSGVLFDLSTSTTSFTLTLNTWQHIAGVRNGNTFTIYVNGVSRATTTSASSLYDATNNFTIGAESSTTAQYFTGYISNIRLIKGQALATGNFTPPTALASSTVVGWTGTNVPTQSITGTVSLLTCQSNRFVDNGPNNFTITRNGSTSVQAFSPFAPANAVSPLVTGGSGYFDGTTDYLATPSDAAFGFGTGDFTIETWIYNLGGNTERTLVCVDTTNGLNFWLYGAGGTIGIGRRGVDVNNTFGPTPPLNAWSHIVLARSNSVVTCWVNGVVSGTQSQANSINYVAGPLNVAAIATYGGTEFKGNIAGLRILKGTALYSPSQAVIPIPTTPPTAIPNTSLLLNFTNGAAVDATGKGIAETIAGTQLTVTKATNNYLTGGASVKMTGSGDYIKYAPSVLHDIAGGDFVIEGWFYFTDLSADRAMVSKYGNSSETGGGLGYVLQWFQSGSALRFVLGNSSGDQLYTWSWSPSINTWYYVAVSRNGTNGRAYVGTSGTANQIGSTLTLVTNDLVSPNSLQVGKTHTVAQYLLGYTSSIRITKGSARGYTGSTISIPTGPFPIG